MPDPDMKHTDVRSDFSTLDAGKLLPGCSIPVTRATISDGDSGVHAFRTFEPLPIDGLSKTALRGLADSMGDVARSLKLLHETHHYFGRITSTSFHNRGTTATPLATLWIDPTRAAESDAVHSGDPEAMYWTVARLQSGETPIASDDWYALGIVLAEMALSTASVHKIWALSRQDGDFGESLIKNLKRSRADKRLKKLAIGLIREGSTGKVNPETIAKLTLRRPVYNSTPIYLSIAATIMAIVALIVSQQQKSAAIQGLDKELTELGQRYAQIENQIDEARMKAALVASATVGPAPLAGDGLAPSPVVARTSDRERWTEAVGGRSLEQAVELSSGFSPAQWRESLGTLLSIRGQKQWRTQDPKLRRMVQQAVDAPWQDTAIEAAVTRLTALRQARERWTAWAKSDRSVDDIRTQQELMPSGLMRDLLGQWLSEVLEIRSFDLRAEMIACGGGNEFLAHIIGVETSAVSESIDWAWKKTSGVGESIELNVADYRAGQSLSFWLQQDSWYWNKTVIEHTLKSPLLVWQLAQGLALSDSESGYSVRLTTNKRFGPPVKLGQSKSRTSTIGSNKRVIDPLDSLPF